MYSHFFKRLIDLGISLLLLPFFALLLLIVGPLIYLTDKGPIFYIAPRLGRNGKVFNMYKFRSMYVNAPDIRNSDGSTFNSENDSRVTRIGRLLRKTSIDELPQFFNVLLGDMSFVGPRPALAGKPVKDFDQNRRKILQVRPGITGYSQAYFRNSISQEEKFKNDCYYVDNMSLIMDCKIIVVTALSVVRRKNINTNR